MNYKITYSNELYHHGIKGQRWGVRRFRNEDGSLTAAGKLKYNYRENKLERLQGKMNKASREEHASKYVADRAKLDAEKYRNDSKNYPARNVFFKVMRQGTQARLDYIARQSSANHALAKNKLSRIMKKAGNLPYAETKVYLADIWGLPYDQYELKMK